jgi:tRNA pseudouridine(55) synthase
MEGLIIFNKPPKLTSTQVVNYFKQKFKIKAGHGGTLDPLANGLLIIGLDKATKDLKFFTTKSKKKYSVTAIIGIKSITYDIEPFINNKEIAEGNNKKIKSDCLSLPSAREIKKTLKDFQGVILQSPPLFSAVKFKGTPLYRLAREGKRDNVILPQRLVKVYELTFQEYKILNKKDIASLGLNLESNDNLGLLRFEVIVSSGTYIRSLVNELGEKIKCGACLFSLSRKEIEVEDENFYQKYGCSKFDISQSLTFDNFENGLIEFKGKIFGLVQGVNYRYFTFKIAQELKINGYVKNLEDNSVEIIAQGKIENLSRLINFLKKGPPLAKVEEIKIIFTKPLISFKNFSVIY